MAEFKVIEVVDGETIKTLPTWNWKNRDGKQLSGETVKVRGYNIDSKDKSAIALAKARLENLLLNKYISLKNPVELPGDKRQIECMIFLNDVDISTYFPEYQNS